MPHFLVELTYTVPPDRMDTATAAHRQFLQAGYERGWLLMSGPRQPRVGGIIIARAPSREALETFFGEDPYQREGLARYRFVEFLPLKHQEWLADWCGDAPK